MFDFNVRTRLSYKMFEQLMLAFEQLVRPLKAIWVKQQVISGQVISGDAISLKAEGWAEFSLFLSDKFKALVLTGGKSSAETREEETIDVGLTFGPEAIASFCEQLGSLSELSGDRLTQINNACGRRNPNDAKIQSDLTLKLVQIVSNSHQEQSPEALTPNQEKYHQLVSICQPIENALQQQIKQEKLLYRVTTQIRRSLELPVILSTAVKEVRRCLEVDRLLIYEFQRNHHNQTSCLSSNKNSQVLPQTPVTSQSLRGWMTYESLSSQDIPSVLGLDIGNDIVGYLELQDTDINQFSLATDDVEVTYKNRVNVLQSMQKAQVRSELLSPIVVEEKLWGLLIAHQCCELRQWQESDQRFLRDIAEHLAIAIRQALLYRQLQQQKQTLEERFKNQTQDLRDALIAAEAASRSKSEFLAAMSHELRTPLTCVIGMSSTLLRWSFGQLSDKQRHYIKTIYDSGEHLLELINDILELSQLEAGKAVLNLQEIYLVQLADLVLKEMAEKARNSEISLKTDFQLQPEGDRLTADFRRIKQVFYNLLSNAIKFTPAGGQVTTRLWRENQKIVLQVEDTGMGIPKEQQALIFSKFQQLDSSYHRNYEGTGLGLALTKQLVELHGGWINVSSDVGVGSTFTVELPIKKNQP